MEDIDEGTRKDIEAATFQRLIAHLRDRTDVQNIEIMELAGFCRNCLSKWYREAAAAHGVEMELDEVREKVVYGMPYAQWKSKHQTGPKKPKPS